MSLKNTGISTVAEGETDYIPGYQANRCVKTEYLGKERKDWIRYLCPIPKGDGRRKRACKANLILLYGEYFCEKCDAVVGIENALIKGADGDAFYLKNGDQWYFKPKGEEEFYRVKWYNLEANVEVGFFGDCIYTGSNPAIKGKKGEIHFTETYDWIFTTEDDEGIETYRIKSPESVEFI